MTAFDSAMRKGKMILPEELTYIHLPDGRSYCEFPRKHYVIKCGVLLVMVANVPSAMCALGFDMSKPNVMLATDHNTYMAFGTLLPLDIKQRTAVLISCMYDARN